MDLISEMNKHLIPFFDRRIRMSFINEMNQDLLSLVSAVALNEARFEIYVANHKGDLEKIALTFVEELAALQAMQNVFNDNFGDVDDEKTRAFKENVQRLDNEINTHIDKVRELLPEDWGE